MLNCGACTNGDTSRRSGDVSLLCSRSAEELPRAGTSLPWVGSGASRCRRSSGGENSYWERTATTGPASRASGTDASCPNGMTSSEDRARVDEP